MKNSKRIAIFVLSLVILSSGSLSARSKNERYNQRKKMTYSYNEGIKTLDLNVTK